METDKRYTNHLINESSPYLLQHAHNPVDWYPWGPEALEKAKSENKLLIVSIGYAACHWCHVMEHESFEDEEVAAYMNKYFVPIKVDREERPDIDLLYMHAVQLLTRHGGWPLNCIAFADGRPVYGGTYFPKEQWIDLLKAVYNFVKKNPEKANQQANYLIQGIKSSELIFSDNVKQTFSVRDLDNVFHVVKSSLDFVNGGNKGAPKFPMPSGTQFLLLYNYITNNSEALDAVNLSLNKMADGGIYDQAGGGFCRYSTDAYWKVPHFEKMLYDNAQLVSLYSAAFQLNKNKKYRTVVSETLEFIQRELTSPDGGFYSSLDADSEGEEGKFYVWTAGEIRKLLGEKARLFLEYFNVTEEGNWGNGRNILFKTSSDSDIAVKYGISESELEDRINEAKNILLSERNKRVRPGLDDKILTSWNALMIKGYSDAYRIFDKSEYLDAAVRNAGFINNNLRKPDNRLDRNFKKGKSTINAFLDDYAYLISAFISLYQADFNEKWLEDSRRLTDYTIDHFYDSSSGMFYYTSDIDPPLVARKMEISDNVVPASNSEMAKNLYFLGHYFYNDDYISKSLKMLSDVRTNILEGGHYYANWACLLGLVVNGITEVAIAGDDYRDKRKEFDRYYLPVVLYSGGEEEGSLPLMKEKNKADQTYIYVCRNKTCQLPVTEVKDALKQISSRQERS